MLKWVMAMLLSLVLGVSYSDEIFAATVESSYVISYHVGEYSFQTDTSGNRFAIIDGVKYNYGDEWNGSGFLVELYAQENQNVIYELHNNEIVATYTISDVLKLKFTAEPDIEDGVIYENGKFSPKKFGLVLKVTNDVQDYFKDRGFLLNLNRTEKERLYFSLKHLSIIPYDNVNFGSSGWWIWEEYQKEISKDINQKIYLGETVEYTYQVNLENAYTSMKEYNIDLQTVLTYDKEKQKKEQVRVRIGNLDYQEEKTQEKKQSSKTGQTLATASSELGGLKTAIQFSKNYFSVGQKKQINEFVNLWIAELILAEYEDKSDIGGKVTEKIADKWLEKLGADTSVILVSGRINAATFLETETKDGEKVYIEFIINTWDFDFGNSGMPTMATGSGSATVYNKDGVELDSSVILPAYADISAFCEQLQEVAEETIFDMSKEYLGIFGVSAEATAEALSSRIMTKLLNCNYTKNVFKTVNAADMKKALEKITVEAEEYANKKIFKLLTTPEQGRSKVTIKCPVDIKIYDNDGNLCGVISDNTVDSAYTDIYMSVVGDKKNIYLVGDDYTFEMTGTDSGTMDYIVEEFDENGNKTREISYEDVVLSEGCKYYSYVPEAGDLNSALFDLTDRKGNPISPTSGKDEDYQIEKAEIIKSGNCGDEVEYILYDTGELVIYGNGEMWNYGPEVDKEAPWSFLYGYEVKEIYINSGVTNIGDWAFYHCSSLNRIDIPSGITSIGNNAFASCSSLSSIEIPNGVTNIGYGAFTYCSSLSSIEIPKGVTNIGDNTFYHCSNLSSIEIPSGVTNIGDIAFASCSSLSSIEIPSGVTNIGDSAFADCNSLSSIEIPSGVTNIGGSAFSCCSNLKNVYYSGDEETWNQITIWGCNEDLLNATIHYNSAMPDNSDNTNSPENPNNSDNLTTGLAQSSDGNWYYYKDGKIDKSFSGLYCDETVGWWLVNNGSVDFNYTGLYYDTNYGWWLIGGGSVCFDYNGLWGDPIYGWWLVNGGTVNFGYTGLYYDVNCGWWLIGGGSVCFDYNGLWGDPIYGWWLISGGTVDFGYTGLYYDVNCGWWLVTGGAVDFGYTGEVYYEGVLYYVRNGQLA